MLHESVVVTGTGIVLPGCNSSADMWQQIQSGQPQLTLKKFKDMDSARCMGKIENLERDELRQWFPSKFVDRYPWEIQVYLTALTRSLIDAGLEPGRLSAELTGIFDGTSRGPFNYWLDSPDNETLSTGSRDLMFGTPGQAASIAASLLGTHGNVLTFSTSCTSAAVAIGQAFEQVQSGKIDVALAGGHETPLGKRVFDIYVRAGLISETDSSSCRLLPYKNGEHTILGEGAVSMVLEAEERARSRGADILARIIGYQHLNSGFHPTSIDASGNTAISAVRRLLEQTGIEPSEIKAIVGHGNGIPKSDRSEMILMDYLKQQGSGEIPLISLKPAYGHNLGAASAVNIGFAAIALKQQLRFDTASPFYHFLSTDLAAPDRKHGQRDIVLSVSYGIGGHYNVMALEGVTPGG